jgi:hypothetical protein
LEVANHCWNDPFWLPTRLSFFIFPFRGSELRENYFFYSAGFSPANLSEQSLRAVVGVERVSH